MYANTIQEELNYILLLLLCIFSLFYVRPDLLYVAAFLCALILCSADRFLNGSRIFGALCVCFFAAFFLVPPFFFFAPAVMYGLFRRRLFPAAGLCIILFLLCAFRLHISGTVLFFLELFGFAAGFLLAKTSRECSELKDALRRIQDDSAERDILLTEKNRTLLEKQDYEIYTATLKERNRIAREIHDNVGHLLSRSILLVGAVKSVNRNPSLAQTIDSLDETLSQAMTSIRASVHDLRDDAVNLDEAVRSLLREFTFCPVSYCFDAGRFIPRDVKYSFISIIKEALSNIMRHSSAENASITIREHPALYQLCIENDGPPGVHPPEVTGGMGLSNMRERVNKLGGSIHFFTENGFKILITIPKRSSYHETDTD